MIALAAVPIGVACGHSDQFGPDIGSDGDAVRASAGTPARVGSEGGAGGPGIAAAAGVSGTLGSASRAAGSGGGAGASAAAAGGSGAADGGANEASDSHGAGIGTTGTVGAVSAAGSGAGTGGATGAAGTAAAGGAAPTPVDADCDLNGIWIARLTTFSRDLEYDTVQTASHWFYYELAQSGRHVTVAKALDCGIQMTGSADITLNTTTTRALLHANDQAGRRGEFYKDAGRCALRFERFYSARGVPRTAYLPADPSTNPELSSLEPPLPTEQMPSGAQDWDEDGTPGITFNVAGLGSRDVVQRDWNEFWSDPTSGVAVHTDEFEARAAFDSQENILATSDALDGQLSASMTPATDMRHRMLFRRIARSPSDAAAAAVRVPDDLETCYKVQSSLPHDPTMH